MVYLPTYTYNHGRFTIHGYGMTFVVCFCLLFLFEGLMLGGWKLSSHANSWVRGLGLDSSVSHHQRVASNTTPLTVLICMSLLDTCRCIVV